MNGEQRRQEILAQIKQSTEPVSGTELAKCYQVSRQVIVQDIALLRVTHKNIVATNRGYMLNAPRVHSRIFKVFHRYDEIVDELYTVVDLGARVTDVFVNHKVYGQVKAKMSIRSRRDVEEFMEEIRAGKSTPLMNITSGYHYHTIEAETKKVLEIVEKALKEKGYLVE